MGTDRTGWLIAEAAVRGVIDYSEARFFDPIWNRKVALLLVGLQRLNAKEMANIRHRHYCAMLGMKQITPESSEEIQNKAIEEVQNYEDAFLPNAKAVRDQAEQSAVQGRISKWEGRWGKMSDPETQERIRRTAEALRDARLQTAHEDSHKSIEGLMGMTGRQRRATTARR